MPRTLIKESAERIGEKIKVNGWVSARRDHGKIIFIDVKDISGVLQIVFIPKDKELYKTAESLGSEFAVSIEGQINQRPEKMVNDKILTGKVEMLAEKLEILNKSEILPFELDADKEPNEEIRMEYRYIDLRREKMKENMLLRGRTIKFMRQYFWDKGFTEIETPLLTKSTPEGARDYIVPARLERGKFYALPQSPQQYKQLLMVAQFEKYFQVARCLRDEDTRGDRQPEFTQFDVEMSFVEQEDIINLTESMLIELVKKETPEKHITNVPFPRLTYKEAMEKYNSDKPDLREDKKDKNELAFCWIVDFPMFEWKETENRWDATHHPFTMPQEQDIEKMKKDPGKVPAFQYDIALNGYEIGGGSIRSHKPEILEAVFEIMGHTKENIQQKFGHLLRAFKFGVPPHGGIALGLDRLIMILRNEKSIRDVIAFPKTGDGRDLLMNAPSEVDEEQLKELNIKIAKKDKK
ncbi:MAG: hypothetical protein US76_00165 [Parcubacteria group bacterium GW2011_GWA2_38_13b]|nr:MAG: hypothetical protein US76_00165 [Parcubacteria group bacterium GW2011_GWA2_38_13b]